MTNEEAAARISERLTEIAQGIEAKVPEGLSFALFVFRADGGATHVSQISKDLRTTMAVVAQWLAMMLNAPAPQQLQPKAGASA